MAAPFVVEKPSNLGFSASSIIVTLGQDIKPGDVIIAGAVTNNGAQANVVHMPGPIVPIQFAKIATGFDFTLWAVQAPFAMTAPIDIFFGYDEEYNTTANIVVNVRGAWTGAGGPFDMNASLPAVETGNPAPSPTVFSTNNKNDLALWWCGAFVGFSGTRPWEDPTLTGNTVGPGVWNWENGLNNTELLQPISLCVYSQTETARVKDQLVSSSSPDLQGAAYILVALTADAPSGGTGNPSWLKAPDVAVGFIDAVPIPPQRICFASNTHVAGGFYGPLAPLGRPEPPVRP